MSTISIYINSTFTVYLLHEGRLADGEVIWVLVTSSLGYLVSKKNLETKQLCLHECTGWAIHINQHIPNLTMRIRRHCKLKFHSSKLLLSFWPAQSYLNWFYNNSFWVIFPSEYHINLYNQYIYCIFTSWRKTGRWHTCNLLIRAPGFKENLETKQLCINGCTGWAIHIYQYFPNLTIKIRCRCKLKFDLSKLLLSLWLAQIYLKWFCNIWFSPYFTFEQHINIYNQYIYYIFTSWRKTGRWHTCNLLIRAPGFKENLETKQLCLHGCTGWAIHINQYIPNLTMKIRSCSEPKFDSSTLLLSLWLA